MPAESVETLFGDEHVYDQGLVDFPVPDPGNIVWIQRLMLVRNTRTHFNIDKVMTRIQNRSWGWGFLPVARISGGLNCSCSTRLKLIEQILILSFG